MGSRSKPQGHQSLVRVSPIILISLQGHCFPVRQPRCSPVVGLIEEQRQLAAVLQQEDSIGQLECLHFVAQPDELRDWRSLLVVEEGLIFSELAQGPLMRPVAHGDGLIDVALDG